MLTVKTNNVPREYLYAEQMPDSAWLEVDYPDDIGSEAFFKYAGEWYALNDFIHLATGSTPNFFKSEWDAFYPITAFSGVVMRYIRDEALIVVGYYTYTD